ncbi:MAG: glycosyltransferase [Gemmatimonadales bacterium]|nr:glycosyltransferase [Gemmatimonadales bacterium]NIN11640.1 glycosyltransferase [Gemmatimonadales bacterium]NIN50246.1 glycosyltransferase [Gemmatimonadales bacterium]NIP07710.1 glycosyltransferase [Gemmatimonadales bacterium]NIR01862.1 glycosyltransferase [Gemmatimonadales bacterium]
MHLIFVTHAYPREDGDVAGAFVERLVVTLRARGHTLTVVAPADGRSRRREQRNGVEIVRARYAPSRWETLAYRGTMVEEAATPGGALRAASLMVAQARAIRRAARLEPTDVVHAHWWVPGGVSAWMARLAQGPRYVITLHGTDVAILERSRLARTLARRVLRGAAAVTAVSSYLAERAAAIVGLDPQSIVVQPMPADLVQLSRTSVGGGGIVTVGRLVGQKRIDVVLEALARLRRQGRELCLTIIGDGPLREPLKEHAERLGIANATRFLGQVEPSGLSDAIGDADVFVFPAVGEGLGLAAAEALILGIPVVATRGGGGVVDIVPATGAGRIVAEGEPGQMAQAIAEVLNDPEARSLAVEAGRRLKQRLAPGRVAATFEDVYRRVSDQAAHQNA